VSGEFGERLAGPRGPQGNQGERGTEGLSSPVRRALVFLFALSVAVAGVGLFWTAHEVNTSRATQQHAGVLLEEKLCTTFGTLAALKPPAGSAAANPSRAYEQSLHATLDQLGTDLGCR
jgi:hypothetical protein